jgi:hypothetical protein
MSSFASCLASFSGAQFPRQPTASHPGDNLNLSVDVYKGKIFVLVRDLGSSLEILKSDFLSFFQSRAPKRCKLAHYCLGQIGY